MSFYKIKVGNKYLEYYSLFQGFEYVLTEYKQYAYITQNKKFADKLCKLTNGTRVNASKIDYENYIEDEKEGNDFVKKYLGYKK